MKEVLPCLGGRALVARSVLEALCQNRKSAGDDLEAGNGVIVTNSIRWHPSGIPIVFAAGALMSAY